MPTTLPGQTQEIELPEAMCTFGTYGPNDTPYRVYSPNGEVNGSEFVLATGLLARPEQYDILGENLALLGNRLIIFGHDHDYHKLPIRANSIDIVNGVRQLGVDEFIAVGHSMGTIAMLLALEDPEFHKRAQALIQVNPAMTGNHLFVTPQDLAYAEVEALTLFATHPNKTIGYALTATDEVMHRPRVIANQIFRLLTGKVTARYTELMSEVPDLPVYVFYNKRDGLVPPRWGTKVKTLSRNVTVFEHDSNTHLAHSAINVDPDYALALEAIAKHKKLPRSFRMI